MEKKIKFAVLGIGHIGKHHAEIISRNNESELVAIIDCNSKEMPGIEKYGVPFFSSLDDFLTTEIECDVVNIATPNGLHAMQALLCLDKKKHVVIEKPLALSKGDADEVINRSLKVNKHVFTVMQNRYSLPSSWLKEVVSRGLLGKIFIVQLNCYWNRDERYYKNSSWHGSKNLDAGTLFTQFSHFIDILYWLFGDIQNIQSRMMNFNHQKITEFEDSGTVNFDFVNGGFGTINFSTSVWDKNLESCLIIIAEYGSVKISGQYMDKVEYCHIRDYEMPILHTMNSPDYPGSSNGSSANHQYVIAHVVDVLKGRALLTPKPIEGMKVVEIIERIYRAGQYVTRPSHGSNQIIN